MDSDTYRLGDATICPITIPVARALPVQFVPVTIESESTAVTGCPDLKKRPSPVAEKRVK